MSLQLLGKNTSIYALGNVILRAGAFLLIPIHTNYLSIEEYGILASLFVTIEVLTIFMNSGMKNSLVRFFEEYLQKDKINELLGTSILINIIGGIIVTGLCLSFLMKFFETIFHTQNLNYLIELACGAALAEALYFHIASYYQAKNQAKSFLYFGTLSFALLLLFNYILLIELHQGIQGVLFARIFAYGIVLILIAIQLIHHIGMRISFPLGRKLLKFGFPLIFSVSGEKLIHLGMLYLLSFYAGLKEVAIFSLALKFASILGMVLILPVQLALQPYIFANLKHLKIKENLSFFFTYFVMTMSFGSLGVIIFSKIIIPIVSPPEYWIAAQLVILLVPALVIKSFKIYGEAFLNVAHKSYVTGFVVGLIGLLSLYINYIFIVQWGLFGLIGSYNLINLVLAAALFGFGFAAYSIHIDWKRVRIVFAWLLIFVLIAYYSVSKSSLIFYISIILAGFSFISYILIFNFLNEKERQFLNNFLSTIHVRLFN